MRLHFSQLYVLVPMPQLQYRTTQLCWFLISVKASCSVLLNKDRRVIICHTCNHCCIVFYGSSSAENQPAPLPQQALQCCLCSAEKPPATLSKASTNKPERVNPFGVPVSSPDQLGTSEGRSRLQSNSLSNIRL